MNCSEYVTQLVQNNISQVDNFNKLYEKFVEIVGERCEMNNVPAHVSIHFEKDNLIFYMHQSARKEV